MSQFFRKIRNLFGEEIPKKAPPPTKLVSSKISSKNGSDGKTAASNQRNTSPKGQRKSF